MRKQCTSCDKTEDLDDCRSKHHQIIQMLDQSETKVNSTTKTTCTTLRKKVKGWVGDYFVESVLIDSKPYFLCIHKSTNKIEYCDSITIGNHKIIPLEKQDCGYFPYSFTKEEMDELISTNQTKEELLDDIKSQIDKFISLKEIDKHLILGDMLLTYCQEWITTTHFLFVVGETESGKSSVLHLFKWLSYRCLYGEGISEANIYNFLGTDEESTGTISEDEVQGLEYNKEKLGIYKNSYSKGSVKPKVFMSQNSKTQVYYKTFCFKIFGGEKLPQDKGFLERLSVIHMVDGEPQSNIKRVTQQEQQELFHLRNKLLVWKMKNMVNGLKKIDSRLKGRDQELWEDFLSTVHDTKYYEECRKTVKYYVEQRHKEIWNSLESKIFTLLVQQLNENLELNFIEFWNNITNDNPELPGELNKKTFYPDGFQKITTTSLPRLLEDKFQGEKRTKTEKDESGKSSQKTFYVFKLEVIQKLVKKYNVTLPLDSPVYSGTSGQSGQLGVNKLFTDSMTN